MIFALHIRPIEPVLFAGTADDALRIDAFAGAGTSLFGVFILRIDVGETGLNCVELIAADAAKDNFIATVSHELRTPLNAISGWTTLLRGKRLDPEKTERGLDVIGRNVNAQLQLVEDLLDVSRITSGKLSLDVQDLDLASIVSAAVEACALAVEAKAKLLLIDEVKGRALAQRLGLKVLGSVGVCVLAKERGLIAAARPLLDDLRHRGGRWFSDALLDEVLSRIGE